MAQKAHFPSFRVLKLASCVSLLFFTVSTTVFTEASKNADGAYPYNTFVIPCTVEAVKLVVSLVMLVCERAAEDGSSHVLRCTLRSVSAYMIPALCYFVSNNCAFYIIQNLGATTFQIMNNLKVLSTCVFMRIFLKRELLWLQWKALIMLVIGAMVTQLRTNEEVALGEGQRWYFGYSLVIVNVIAAGAGGAFSEKLLKGVPLNGKRARRDVSIHWQNVQLYAFGFAFGLLALRQDPASGSVPGRGIFDGFNTFAYATVVTLSVSGLLVSFILKYLDNVAKCFCATLSMLCVMILDSALKHETIRLQTMIGVVLTGLALEQYHLS